MRRRGCEGASTIHSLIYKFVDDKQGTPQFKLDDDSDAMDAELIVIDEVSDGGPTIGRGFVVFWHQNLGTWRPVFNCRRLMTQVTSPKPKLDFMLTEIHRQAADNPIVRLSLDIRENGRLDYGEFGESKVVRKRDVDRDQVLLADQILCGTNATRISYNDRVRELKNLPPQEPVVGDKLICLRNNHQKQLLNGQLWIAEDVVYKGLGVLDMVLNPDDAGDRDQPRQQSPPTRSFSTAKRKSLAGENAKSLTSFISATPSPCTKRKAASGTNVYLFDESWAFREDRARPSLHSRHPAPQSG